MTAINPYVSPMKWMILIFGLIALGGCASSEVREVRDFNAAEEDSRSDRSEFLAHLDALRNLAPSSEEQLKEIQLLAAQMTEAQSRRLKGVEGLPATFPALKKARLSLIKAELNIYNGTVAFKGGVQGTKLSLRQYRVHLSALEEATMESEGAFLSYENQMKALKAP
jgi:hypothetical protein